MIFYGYLLPLLAGLYGLLMAVYRLGWHRQALVRGAVPGSKPTVSIIIPARNEAGNIGACLASLLAQDYPRDRVEIIVVDDHSEDQTAAIARSYAGVKCLPLKEYLLPGESPVAYKKKALGAGIAATSGEIIITTDADCLAPLGWLAALAAAFEARGAVLLAAPVDFTNDGSLVQTFQSLDFMTMQGITAAAHALNLGGMANGANLAFTRAAFMDVGGYAGTEHLASGDDYLLLAKMRARFLPQTGFLKSREAIMRTAPQPDWRGFLRQRIRWASKSGKYKDHRLTAILGLVYLFNLALLGGTIGLFWMPSAWPIVAGGWCWKVVLELLFLYPVAGFFGKRRELLLFPLLQPLHVLYIVSAGFLGAVGKFEWKGRVVR